MRRVVVGEPSAIGAGRRRVDRGGDLGVDRRDDLGAVAQVDLVAVVPGGVVAGRAHHPGVGAEVAHGEGQHRRRAGRGEQQRPGCPAAASTRAESRAKTSERWRASKPMTTVEPGRQPGGRARRRPGGPRRRFMRMGPAPSSPRRPAVPKARRPANRSASAASAPPAPEPRPIERRRAPPASSGSGSALPPRRSRRRAVSRSLDGQASDIVLQSAHGRAGHPNLDEVRERCAEVDAGAELVSVDADAIPRLRRPARRRGPRRDVAPADPWLGHRAATPSRGPRWCWPSTPSTSVGLPPGGDQATGAVRARSTMATALREQPRLRPGPTRIAGRRHRGRGSRASSASPTTTDRSTSSWPASPPRWPTWARSSATATTGASWTSSPRPTARRLAWSAILDRLPYFHDVAPGTASRCRSTSGLSSPRPT